MPVSVCIIHLNVGNGNEKTAVAMFNHVYSENNENKSEILRRSRAERQVWVLDELTVLGPRPSCSPVLISVKTNDTRPLFVDRKYGTQNERHLEKGN